MRELVSDSDWIPESAAEWNEWLSAEEHKTRNAYLAKPATLISDYRREIATSRDYEGRELLELLQNAADQARDAGVPGRVVVEITSDGMVVANTGTPFSVGGVASLETANLSPKHHRRRQYIGNKGLGFRSVLNWTQAPIIVSGALSLVYTRQHLDGALSSLVSRSDELRAMVNAEQPDTDAPPIPVLPFPVFSQDGSIGDLIDSGAAKRLLEQSIFWQAQGYDTVIAMPFAAPDYFSAAREQKESLRPEILLFVDYLNEIRFITTGEDDVLWKLDGDTTSAMVSENGDPLGIWQVHAKHGSIPKEFLETDQQGELDYEIIVAIPEVEYLEELASSTLFSYFPTQIDLPLPVVAHATLELDQSRNHAQQRASNIFVLGRVAEFIAEVAERRSEQYPSGAKAGIHLVIPLGTYPGELESVSFPASLMQAARTKRIVPTLSGKTCQPSKALQIPGASSSWLPSESFGDIVLMDELDPQVLDDLQVQQLDDDQFRERLLGLGDLSFEERVALIAGLIDNGIDDGTHSSALLLDHDGATVPDGAAVFLAPSSGDLPSLPSWVKLRFLSDSLRTALSERLDTTDLRDLQKKLATFGVLEYSLSTLIQRLVAAAGRQIKEWPGSSTQINRELLEAIFFLYRSVGAERTDGHETRRPVFPTQVTIFLPSQAGEFCAANTRLAFNRSSPRLQSRSPSFRRRGMAGECRSWRAPGW